MTRIKAARPIHIAWIGFIVLLAACEKPSNRSIEIGEYQSKEPAAGVAGKVESLPDDVDLVSSEPSQVPVDTAINLWSGDRYDRETAIEDAIESEVTSEFELWLLLTDADHRVRQQTIDLLADRGSVLDRDLLMSALTDSHPAVRQAAEEALTELSR